MVNIGCLSSEQRGLRGLTQQRTHTFVILLALLLAFSLSTSIAQDGSTVTSTPYEAGAYSQLAIDDLYYGVFAPVGNAMMD